MSGVGLPHETLAVEGKQSKITPVAAISIKEEHSGAQGSEVRWEDAAVQPHRYMGLDIEPTPCNSYSYSGEP